MKYKLELYNNVMILSPVINDNRFTLTESVVFPDKLLKKMTFWNKRLRTYSEIKKLKEKNPKKKVSKITGSLAKLYDIANTEDGISLMTFPGFAAECIKFLSDAGHEISIIDNRIIHNYDIEKARPILYDYQMEAVKEALKYQSGIITLPTGTGKTYICAGIIKAIDKEHLNNISASIIAVISPGVDLADKNYKALKELLPDRNVGIITGNKKKYSDDVVVITPESFKNVPSDQVGVIIYDEVHSLSQKRAEDIIDCDKAIRIGLSATPTGRFDGGDAVVKGVIGPIIFKQTYKEAVALGAVVPIKVLWLDLIKPDNYEPEKFTDKTVAYRWLLWRNNLFIACLHKLLELIPDEIQTLCLIESLEQMARFINKKYYPYVHGETDPKKFNDKRYFGLKAIKTKDRKRFYNAVRNGSIRKIISSGIYRVGVDFPEIAVVINASGRGSQIIAGQLPGRASRKAEGKTCSYIIDFWHEWDRDEKNKPGHILKDDMSRAKTYGSLELGFEQIHFNSLTDIINTILNNG